MTSRRSLREFGLVLATATILCVGLVVSVAPLDESQLEDSRVYIAMAERPHAEHAAPYCYRVLVPTLARLLPLDLTTSFFALTLCFIAATGVLLYYLLRAMGMARFISAVGMLLFYGLNWGARFAFFDFRLTDPALFFLATASLLLIVKGRLTYAVVTLALGVLAKESALFLLPFVYTLRARRFLDPTALLTALVVGAVPVVVFLLVRWSIPGEYNPAALWSTIGTLRIEDGMAGFVRGGTVGTWGVGMLLASLFSGLDLRTFSCSSRARIDTTLRRPSGSCWRWWRGRWSWCSRNARTRARPDALIVQPNAI